MTQIDEDSPSHHLEVVLAGAAPERLDALAETDRYQRGAAVADIARHLAERLGCFDIQREDLQPCRAQSSLFPNRLGPIG